MKLCVSARQEPKYLDWAEEIIFEYKDREGIFDFIQKFPDKTIILIAYNEEDLDWAEIQKYNILTKEKFILALNNFYLVNTCKEQGIKFYFGYPITSYDELTAALAMGSYYVRLGAPLFFDMDYIKTHFPEAKIRLIPNVAYDDFYFRENGIPGTWIRPEDIRMYDPYAEVIEFNDANLMKERALIRIYWEERYWPGDLQMIITNLNAEGVNRFIPSEVTEKRLNCRQICKARRHCKICFNALFLANETRLQQYKDLKDANKLNPLNID